ncbi:hypothetical protein ES707_00183 [subsurface metagenome]
MKAKRRRLGQYRCWLCGKDLEITTPPYLRNGNCHCEEEGLLGGGCVPYGLTEEEVERARQEYARTHGESR